MLTKRKAFPTHVTKKRTEVFLAKIKRILRANEAKKKKEKKGDEKTGIITNINTARSEQMRKSPGKDWL